MLKRRSSSPGAFHTPVLIRPRLGVQSSTPITPHSSKTSSSQQSSHPPSSTQGTDPHDRTFEPDTEYPTVMQALTALPFNLLLVEPAQLAKLFCFCPSCGSFGVQIAGEESGIKKIGSAIEVQYMCSAEKCPVQNIEQRWCSQSAIPGSPQRYGGNLRYVAGALTAGLRSKQIDDFCDAIGLPAPSPSTFDRYQRDFVAPSIALEFKRQQDAVLEQLRQRHRLGLPVNLIGDARASTVGHNTKFMTYVLCDAETGKVASQSVVEKNINTSAISLEVIGLRNCLKELFEAGVHIDRITTDQHSMVITVFPRQAHLSYK